MSPVYQIAIDGPAASGKSTTARGVAQALGIRYLDTGAMYRAFMLRLLEAGADYGREEGVAPWLEQHGISLDWDEEGTQRVYLSGEDVSGKIRENRISTTMGPVCAMPSVRETMVRLQRRIGSEGSCVIDGRDIGTVVFPDALFKFFLVASSRERARRRQLELEERGQAADLEQLVRELEERDRRDRERSAGPLRQAEDARLLDTGGLTIRQQIQAIVDVVRERLRAEET